MHKILVLGLLVFLFAVPTNGQTDREKFELYNRCSKTILYVGLDEGAKKLGITEKSVRNLVESRLRSARIYDEKSSSSFLGVGMSVQNPDKVGGRTFSVQVNFFQLVSSPGGYDFAITWSRENIGTLYSRDKDFVLSPLPEYIDEFINGYLKVNQKDCK